MNNQQEIDFIKQNYLDLPIRQIAIKLNRSRDFVSKVIKKHGLVIPSEILKQRAKNGGYKIGNIPANKGKTQKEFMSAEGYKRSVNSRFKKGNKPSNTLPIYEIRKRKKLKKLDYYYIKLPSNKWVLLHRYLWELHYGKLNRSEVIYFKDGNTLNVNIDNLEMCSRAEHAIHNRSGGAKLDTDTKNTISLIYRLIKKIKNL